MSVVILGGNECMERQYKDLCRDYKCRVKVFIKPVGNLKNKMGQPDLMIFFTSICPTKCCVARCGRQRVCRRSSPGPIPARWRRCAISSIPTQPANPE